MSSGSFDGSTITAQVSRPQQHPVRSATGAPHGSTLPRKSQSSENFRHCWTDPMQNGRRVKVLPPANVSFRCGQRNESPFSLSVADVLISNCLWRFVNVRHLTWGMFHGDTWREKCKRFHTRKCFLHMRSSRETVTKQPSHHNLVGRKMQQFMLHAPSGRRHTECDASTFGFDVWKQKKPQRQLQMSCWPGYIVLQHGHGALAMARHHERNTLAEALWTENMTLEPTRVRNLGHIRELGNWTWCGLACWFRRRKQYCAQQTRALFLVKTGCEQRAPHRTTHRRVASSGAGSRAVLQKLRRRKNELYQPG